MLSWWTLLILLLLWSVVLLPRALRDLRTSPLATVTRFTDAMSRLAMSDERQLVVPAGAGRRVVSLPHRAATGAARPSPTIRRRRTTLVLLLVTTVLTLVVAAVVGGTAAWAAVCLAGASSVAYCAALRVLALRRTRPAPVHDRAAARPPAVAAPTATPPADPPAAAPADALDDGPPPPEVDPPTQVVPLREVAPAAGVASASELPVDGPVTSGALARAHGAWLDDAFDWPVQEAHDRQLVADGS